MSAAETSAEDEQPPPQSLEVPMEAVPDVVVPRLELAVRVPTPLARPEDEVSEPVDEMPAVELAVEELPVEAVPVPIAAPVPGASAVTRPVRPHELDRRHPVRGLLGLAVIVVFGAVAVSLAVGAAIAVVMLAVRGGVGG